MDKACRGGKSYFFPKTFPKIEKVKYEKTLGLYKLHAEFEIYFETGEAFLQDAWVVTK